MPVIIRENKDIPLLSQSFATMDNSTHFQTDQFYKLIGNISSFHTVQQIQQFMLEFLHILSQSQDINSIHNILFTMLTSSKHLLSLAQLQQFTNVSQFIANTNQSFAIDNPNKYTPTPSPILSHHTCANNAMQPLMLSKRTHSLPLQMEYTHVQNVLQLPEHILSYCCSYLATKDLLLSADLCCKELFQIARMPSSFHGKFIFGSAIHSEYHKRNGYISNDTDMLDRFRYSREIHFINIFNYDTIQLLKQCHFPKIESLYLYDRFNYLIEYLPSLIPDIHKLYIVTAGGNETLDIIEANTQYYSDQLYELFNGYKDSVESIELKHNTYYDIPLMLPDKISKLLLQSMAQLRDLELKNVYFPPDLEHKCSENIQTAHSVRHLCLRPYNEYCSEHFDPMLESLAMYWNIVGQNDIYHMCELKHLRRFQLFIALDNDSMDYDALDQFIIQSQCMKYIDTFEMDIDLNNAMVSCLDTLLRVSNHFLSSLVTQNRDTLGQRRNIEINIRDICASNAYYHMFNAILPQLVIGIIRNIETVMPWNIRINISHSVTESENDYHYIEAMVSNLKMNCDSMLRHKMKTNISVQCRMANQNGGFNLKSITDCTNSIFL